MKNLFLAALATLSLSVAVLPAYAAGGIAGRGDATVFQQTGSAAGDGGGS